MLILNTYEHSVDERGRVAIPARYRDALGSVVVVAKGPDGCLEVYTPSDFEQKVRRILDSSVERQRDRRLRRALWGGAAEAEIDKQGRVLVPAAFRQWAGMTGQVVIVGQGTFIEIWSAERWQVEEPIVEENFGRTLESQEPRG